MATNSVYKTALRSVLEVGSLFSCFCCLLACDIVIGGHRIAWIALSVVRRSRRSPCDFLSTPRNLHHRLHVLFSAFNPILLAIQIGYTSLITDLGHQPPIFRTCALCRASGCLQQRSSMPGTRLPCQTQIRVPFNVSSKI